MTFPDAHIDLLGQIADAFGYDILSDDPQHRKNRFIEGDRCPTTEDYTTRMTLHNVPESTIYDKTAWTKVIDLLRRSEEYISFALRTELIDYDQDMIIMTNHEPTVYLRMKVGRVLYTTNLQKECHWFFGIHDNILKLNNVEIDLIGEEE